MRITILCVGKIKEKYYRDAVLEYTKRLSRYCKPEIIEVADEKTLEHASPAEEEGIKRKEADRILKALKMESHIITLEIAGKKCGSVAFAGKLEKLGVMGQSHITFIIGGSLGLHESVTKLSDEKISFSDMTFPHQLMRIILLEQIYRGYRIINGEPYHK